MAVDFVGCYVIEKTCKMLFATLEPKPMITRGRERREARRQLQEKKAFEEEQAKLRAELEKTIAANQEKAAVNGPHASGRKGADGAQRRR